MGQLMIAAPGKNRTLTWNGIPEERAEVEREFNKLMATGLFLAYAVDTKTKDAEQIRDFDAEQEQIVLTPRLVGGAAFGGRGK